MLANQPGLDEIVARIRRRKAERKEEERIKAEKVTAWRNGLLELTDLEIYELALKILVDKLHVYGYVGFCQQHFKHLNGAHPIDQPPHPHSDKDVRLGQTEQMPTPKPHG